VYCVVCVVNYVLPVLCCVLCGEFHLFALEGRALYVSYCVSRWC